MSLFVCFIAFYVAGISALYTLIDLIYVQKRGDLICQLSNLMFNC